MIPLLCSVSYEKTIERTELLAHDKLTSRLDFPPQASVQDLFAATASLALLESAYYRVSAPFVEADCAFILLGHLHSVARCTQRGGVSIDEAALGAAWQRTTESVRRRAHLKHDL